MPLTKIKSLGITDGTILGTDVNSTFDLTGKTVTLPAGVGGKILQVVSTVYTTAIGTSSTSYSDIGISASITPSSTSNKILVNYSLNALTSRLSSGYYRGWIKSLRGATEIQEDFFGGYINVGGDNNLYGSANKSFIDSPSSTSSLTYKLQFRAEDSNVTFYISENSKKCNLILMEIAG